MYNQYEKAAHYDANAKNPTDYPNVPDFHTVVQIGVVMDEDLSYTYGYRARGYGLRRMGEISQDSKEVLGEDIVELTYSPSAGLFRIGFDGAQLTNVDTINVTLPSGQNFACAWDAASGYYVKPFLDPDHELTVSGVAIAIQLEAIVNP